MIRRNRPTQNALRFELWVRIPHPKIDKLACQAQGAGIFILNEIPVLHTKGTPCGCPSVLMIRRNRLTQNALRFELWVRIPHPKIDKLACQTQGAGIFILNEIPVLHTKGTPCGCPSVLMIRRNRLTQNTLRFELWVRNIAPSLPCRKPCRTEQIPVQNPDGLDALGIFSFYALAIYPYT